MKKFAVALCLIFAAGHSPASDRSCDQNAGNKSFSDGNLDNAFAALYDCEFDKNATGLSLGQLAYLYGTGHGIVPSVTVRRRKVFSLFSKAARLGNLDAISTLARVYESGDPDLKLKASQEIAKCLDEITANSSNKDEDVEPRKVIVCLGGDRS